MGPCRAARVPLGLASTRLELPWGTRAPFRGGQAPAAAAPKAQLEAPCGAAGRVCITSDLYTGSSPFFL